MYFRWCTLLSTLRITSYSWIVRSNRTLMNRSVCRRCRNGPTKIIKKLKPFISQLIQQLMTWWSHETKSPRFHVSLIPWVYEFHESMIPWVYEFHESMIPWVYDSMSQWLHDYIITWLHDCLIAWLHDCMSPSIHKPTNRTIKQAPICIKCRIIPKWKLTHMKKIQHLFLSSDDRDESILN